MVFNRLYADFSQNNGVIDLTGGLAGDVLSGGNGNDILDGGGVADAFGEGPDTSTTST